MDTAWASCHGWVPLFIADRGRSRLQLLTAPAGVNGSVMPRLFVAAMELVIWKAFGLGAPGNGQQDRPNGLQIIQDFGDAVEEG